MLEEVGRLAYRTENCERSSQSTKTEDQARCGCHEDTATILKSFKNAESHRPANQGALVPPPALSGAEVPSLHLI